jgi:hypothetical protein
VQTTYNELTLKYSAQGDLSQLMANTTVKHYLGGEWVGYVHYKSPHARYLRVADVDANNGLLGRRLSDGIEQVASQIAAPGGVDDQVGG